MIREFVVGLLILRGSWFGEEVFLSAAQFARIFPLVGPNPRITMPKEEVFLEGETKRV